MSIKKIYIFNYLQRIVNALGGIGVIFVISIYYSLEDSDKFYSVFSLLGLIAFYEFGYATLIVQRISYYSIGENIRNIRAASDIRHYKVLITLFSIAVLLSFPLVSSFLVDSVSFTFLAFLGLLLAVNLKLTMSINILEGLGHLEEVAKIRLTQAMVSYVSMMMLLFFGFGYESVAYQLLIQILIVVPLYFYSYKKIGVSSFFYSESKFKWPDINIISRDFKYSYQLYLTSISTIFSNQIWVLALSAIGVSNLSKYAISFQVIAACAGFSLTPIASRLSHLAKATHLGDAEENKKLIKKILKDIFVVTIVSVVGLLSIYFYAYIYYQERVLGFHAALVMILSLPIIILVNVIGVIVQSRGKRDMLVVSLVKIIVPLGIFFLLDKNIQELTISVCYFSFNLVSLLIAVTYLFKEYK
ncbi:hypothetical protein KW460_18355 [Vibrio fluvialis]|uniref:hypothetical protein n=1 Tax=Vibrio fluvialis TaxID=676 RepID=UPI0006459EAF|nr:hypothetical protein [Vibrio fluvialis]MBY7796431.1 hypothetical protein [Vibrio fluvialis]MBY7839011.1 hypothetical protein [Vibrio fluvialis]MBY8057482.1 hypothetical protein [Vibrio fluvialis]MBY8150819.1 hypothetical protein [Vibrio fluvialis]